MSDGLLQKLVEEDFGYESRGSKWGRSVSHDSLVVNEEEQTFFWNSTGLKGNVYNYLRQVRGMNEKSAREYIRSVVLGDSPKREANYYPPYEKLVELMWANGVNKRDYWYNRCLKDDTIDRYRLGYYDGWNLIPVYDNGDFVDFQMRRDFPDKRITRWYRHGKTLLYNEGIIPFAKTIYITEGTVDAILLNQEGFPAVSPNGTNTWQQIWFNKFSHLENIYYVEDNDKAGRIASKLVAGSLGLSRVRIITWEGKPDKFDTVDFFRSGGTKNEFEEKTANAKYIFELEN